MSLGEEDRFPGLVRALLVEEPNPEAIVGHERPPRLAHQARPHRVLRPQQPQNLHQHVHRELLEVPQGRRLGRGRPAGGGGGRPVGRQFDDLPQDRRHRRPERRRGADGETKEQCRQGR